MRHRKKSSRMRARRTHGYGSQKKHRGGGSKGGKGFAGSFKHKKIFLRKKQPEHFAKKKFKSLRDKNLSSGLEAVNLRDLPEGKEAVLKGFKVLSAGSPPKGIVVRASAFSARAREKIEKAGGKAEDI